MRVTADDDVCAGVGQLAGKRPLHVARTGVALDAPVEEDDDDVCVRSGPLHRSDEGTRILRRCEPGMTRPGCPRRDEFAVDHLCGRDHRDALTFDGRGECRVRVGVVVTDADDEVIR
jgi:hypothetical protein